MHNPNNQFLIKAFKLITHISCYMIEIIKRNEYTLDRVRCNICVERIKIDLGADDIDIYNCCKMKCFI